MECAILLDDILGALGHWSAGRAHIQLLSRLGALLVRVRRENEFRSSARAERAFTGRSEPPKTRVYAVFMASLARALDDSISSNGPLSSSLSCSLSRLADDELLRQLDSVVATQRQQLARLLLLLGEIEERRLHLSRGYSSLFDFCTAALRFSDGEAFRRIAAARLARRFPVVLGQVARGEIHLTGLVLLRDHLTDDNHAELLAAARHRSKREIQGLLAEHFPRPDVKCSVRKLPAPREEVASSLPSWTPAAAVAETSARTSETDASPTPGSTSTSEVPSTPQGGVGEGHGRRPPHPLPPRPTPALIEPLSPARYRVQLTAPQAFMDKFDRARALLAHSCPQGDLAVILERALDALLVDLERSRRARVSTTKKPRSKTTSARQNPVKRTSPRAVSPERNSPPGSAEPVRPSSASCGASPGSALPSGAAAREPSAPPLSSEQVAPSDERKRSPARPHRGTIPRAVHRAVFERDGERCTFVGVDGRRCSARTFLELDHVQPHALGGANTVGNLRVLCRAHNRLFAERTFGREHVENHLRQRKATSSAATSSGVPE